MPPCPQPPHRRFLIAIEAQEPKPEARSPKPETQTPNPETRNPKYRYSIALNRAHSPDDWIGIYPQDSYGPSGCAIVLPVRVREPVSVFCVFVCVCVCVCESECVCERERERGEDRGRDRARGPSCRTATGLRVVLSSFRLDPATSSSYTNSCGYPAEAYTQSPNAAPHAVPA